LSKLGVPSRAKAVAMARKQFEGQLCQHGRETGARCTDVAAFAW
jgi:hypothetical protein